MNFSGIVEAWLIALAGSYLVGSIPTAYLLVKRVKGVDVRTVGSGNPGATNVARAAGLKAGLFVFVLDALKGVVAVTLISPYMLPDIPGAPLLCGIAAVIGHIAPVWLGFKGGKGVATTIGVLASAMPAVALICMFVWIAVFLLFRYVSLASLLAIGIVPLVQGLRHYPSWDITAGAFLALLVVVKHMPNIERLVQGTESRWKGKK